jgi:folate-dependent phosphoribosylglycinamide formyltransferase PurN
VTRVVSDRRDAGAVVRAAAAGIATTHLSDPTDGDALLAALDGISLVVLAGYLKLVPPAVVAPFRWRMVNIHPALLPAFGGAGMYGRRVHEAVHARGTALSGATVHYVTEQFDRGPIIAQWPVPVCAGDTPDTLAKRVLAVEHLLLPAVVTALARLGVPRRAVRLDAAGTAFAAGDQPAVALDQTKT